MDWVSLGVLASSVPRDAVDEAVAATGKPAKRWDGKLPPHVMVYSAMALALFAEEDYEEVAARLTGPLASWGCWDEGWRRRRQAGSPRPASDWGLSRWNCCPTGWRGPVAGKTYPRGVPAGLAADGHRRVRADVPDTQDNAAAFGYPAGCGIPQRSRRRGW